MHLNIAIILNCTQYTNSSRQIEQISHYLATAIDFFPNISYNNNIESLVEI